MFQESQLLDDKEAEEVNEPRRSTEEILPDKALFTESSGDDEIVKEPTEEDSSGIARRGLRRY